jgi:hypothetical protein
MMNFNNGELGNFLTTEQVKALCPKAFYEAPTNPNVSDKYIQANTATVMEDLAKLGWFPVEAKQCRASKKSSGIRSFHMVAFQNPDVKIVKTNDDGSKTVDTYPRIILTNSHDGFNAFKFMVGMFRLICSNGLVVGDTLANMSIRHINYTFEELRKVVNKTIEEIPNIVAQMNEMKTIILDENQKKEIAKEVLRIRKNVNEGEQLVVESKDIEEILKPVREEDKSNDLWTVFNVCQEKLIKGGFLSSGRNNKMRKVRSITSIKKDMDYNQKLWSHAVKYMPVKCA